MNTLLYLDPDFFRNVGHFSRTASLIHEHARATGTPFVHLTHCDLASDAHPQPVQRIFRHRAALHAIPFQPGLLGHFVEDCSLALDRLMLSPEQGFFTLFLYTSHPLHLPALAYLLNHRPGLDRVRAHANILYIDEESYCGSGDVVLHEALLRTTGCLIEEWDPQRRLRIWSDSERTVRHYQRYFQRPLECLASPICRTSVQPRESDSSIVVGYVGQHGSSKGYAAFFRLYRAMRRNPGFTRVRFAVRHPSDDVVRDLRNRFLRYHDRITHLPHPMDDESYESFIRSCDVLVLPYRQAVYPCQTSGVFVDALFQEKIVVVPDDTWMSDQLAHYGSGRTFRSDDQGSLQDALSDVVTKIDLYRASTKRKLDEFRQAHSVRQLFEQLGLGPDQSPGSTPKDESTVGVPSRTEALRTLDYLWMAYWADRTRRRADGAIQSLERSWSWRLTRPLRMLVDRWS